jgi:hypothetical protein
MPVASAQQNALAHVFHLTFAIEGEIDGVRQVGRDGQRLSGRAGAIVRVVRRRQLAGGSR